MIHIQPNMDILYYFMIHIRELGAILKTPEVCSHKIMCLALFFRLTISAYMLILFSTWLQCPSLIKKDFI